MTDTAEYERMLRDQLSERMTDAAALRTSLDAVMAARGDGTADDEHDPEGSTLSSDWSQISGLSAASRDRISEIGRALDRIVDGSYGTCVGCGSAIPTARLDARPSAERCVDCAT